MPMFVPPTDPTVPPVVKPSHPGYELFKHYRPWEAGRNVWLLTGDVVTETEPDNDSDVVRVFRGGHVHEVNAAEAAVLTAAGYTIT
jgi:hypothetical protein